MNYEYPLPSAPAGSGHCGGVGGNMPETGLKSGFRPDRDE